MTEIKTLGDAHTMQDAQPAILVIHHEQKMCNFVLAISSVEIIKHRPTEWRHGHQFTVKVELVPRYDVSQNRG